MWYDLGGAIRFWIDPGVGPRVARYVRGQMAPYRPQAEALAEDVGLSRISGDGADSLLDIENPAGDGLTTGWDGKHAYALRGGFQCSIPDALREHPARFLLEDGFPIWDVWGPLVTPALSLAALRHESVVVHASAVEIDGRAVLVAGWSESGKTEVALALAETGATFISDKWSILRHDGMVSPFPVAVGIRGWVVAFLPRLRAGLPAAARLQLAAARMAGSVTEPLRARSVSGLVAHELSGIAIAAADAADRVSMSSDGIRQIYGASGDPCQPRPLSTVVLLTTSRTRRGLAVEPIEPRAAARRLAQAAAFERRTYFSVTQRIAYATESAARSSMDDALQIERTVLSRNLEGVHVFEAGTDFPQDPRFLADAIRDVIRKRAE
jgi:hypothetical protein